MMKKFLVAFFAVCILSNSFGQNKKKDQDVDIINHEVQLGESVRMISKKYLVDPAEIYKLNKFAVDGISQGMVLKVPVPRKEGEAPKQTSAATTENSNEEQPVADNANPAANSNSTSNELTTATKTTTSNSKDDIKQIIITERKTEVNHKVAPKETLFSLAREYNVAVDDIKASNPEVAKKGLQIGQTIVIPKERTLDIQQSTTIDETKIPKTEKPTRILARPTDRNTEITSGEIIKHIVEPKETLYSLSKKFNVTVDEIKQQNEVLLKNGLQIGQTLIIPNHN